ncbi:hypothetical protein MKZ38_003825 [Zalerion maritima]|uniref:Uncharacterized protein n=1 Tax=Zalerion maritima TaxID=339359 RepID=A0AAD5WRI9_9PEZI|nr:hypothetical protein MKZ38_003825 [Zalerion maritima]
MKPVSHILAAALSAGALAHSGEHHGGDYDHHHSTYYSGTVYTYPYSGGTGYYYSSQDPSMTVPPYTYSHTHSDCTTYTSSGSVYTSYYTSPYSSYTGSSSCPTITSTASICSTCVFPECIGIVTQTSHCGCPSAAATTTVTYDCDTPCEDFGITCAATTYTVIAAEGCEASATATESATGTETETGEVTVTDLETFPTVVVSETGATTFATATEEGGSSSTSIPVASGITENAAPGRVRPFFAW